MCFVAEIFMGFLGSFCILRVIKNGAKMEKKYNLLCSGVYRLLLLSKEKHFFFTTSLLLIGDIHQWNIYVVV